jgi:serine/threonine protein kinase
MLHRENNESVKLSGSLLKTILLDVAKAMKYLHGLTPRKILHRDLKPQNVLVEAKVVSDVPEKRRKRRGDDDDIFSNNIDDGDTAPTLKYKAYVCDFGISRLLPLMANTLKTSTSHTNAGTSNYMAPELFTNDYPCSTKVDVFSFGNIVYECATGRIPFEKECHWRIAFLVGGDKRAEILPEDEVRGDVCELIKTCWKTDPEERPSFAEIVQTIARFPAKKNFDETKEE